MKKYKYCQPCDIQYDLSHEFCNCGNKLVLKQEVETVKPVEMPEATPVFAESGKMSVKEKAAAFFGAMRPKAGLVLPPELDGWVLEDSKPVASTPFYDRFEIFKDGQRAYLNRFKADVITNQETYQQLQKQGLVLHAGRLHNGGNSWDCEVIPALTKQEKSLKAYLSNKQPSEDLALEVVSDLKVLAENMIASGVTPIAISTEFITKHGIDYYGACVSNKGAILPTSALGLLDSKYAAPEVLESKAVANSVVFSFGQMISEALWGGPLALSSLQIDPPFASIQSDLLSTLIMGCLHANPEQQRFALNDFIAAINGEPVKIPEWNGHFSDASKQVFRLGGMSFFRVHDLFAHVSRNPELWDELILNSNFQAFKAFILETPHSTTAALIFDKYQMPSLALIKLQQSICKAPAFYRQYSLSEEDAEASLAALGQKVLNGDKASKAHIEELFKALPEI